MAAASLAAAGVLLRTQSAFAQGAPGATGGNPLGLVVVLAGLALLPFLLIMVTSFVKVAVVLSLLRTAIGAQQVPPNQVITGLAIVLSVYIIVIDLYNCLVNKDIVYLTNFSCIDMKMKNISLSGLSSQKDLL